MKERNVLSHPFKSEILKKIRGEIRDFDYHYFDNPKAVSGFRGFHLSGNAAEGKRNFRKEAKEIAKLKISSLLDIGCAKGFLVGELRKLGIKAYGIDSSAYAIKNAGISVKKYLSLKKLQGLSAKKKYGLIHCSSSLQYLKLSEIKQALKKFRKISSLGIIIDVPTKEDILGWYNSRDIAGIDLLRKQELSQKQWDSLIENAGFRKKSKVIGGFFYRRA
ncbi:class I SAM-dependent methyltransferase [Candidatus Woesearchaeota archaeon]|nr:class I SAM-dependent methyltransferase [Candidatus Woesearchaeota archaeon]